MHPLYRLSLLATSLAIVVWASGCDTTVKPKMVVTKQADPHAGHDMRAASKPADPSKGADTK